MGRRGGDGGESPEGQQHQQRTITTSPCAACKLLRRKCVEECPFSPYFASSEPQKFASVHKTFGASNVSKMLMEVPENLRADVANSLVFEANIRMRDPVYGCLGLISALQQEAQSLQAELHAVRTQIMRFRFQESAMASAASAHHHLSSNIHHLSAIAAASAHHHLSSNIHNLSNINNNGVPIMTPFAFKVPSTTTQASSIISSQTTVNSNDHNTIGSPETFPENTMASIDLKEHYWPQLHQIC